MAVFSSLVRMISNKQGVHLKFLINLAKTPTKALKLLQEDYGDDTGQKLGFLNDTGDSKREERMIPGVIDYPQAELIKMLSV